MPCSKFVDVNLQILQLHRCRTPSVCPTSGLRNTFHILVHCFLFPFKQSFWLARNYMECMAMEDRRSYPNHTFYTVRKVKPIQVYKECRSHLFAFFSPTTPLTRKERKKGGGEKCPTFQTLFTKTIFFALTWPCWVVVFS